MITPLNNSFKATITTTTNTPTPIFSFVPVINTNYLVSTSVSSKLKGALGGGAYLQSRRVENFDNQIHVYSAQSISQNTTLVGSNVNMIVNGDKVEITVTGVEHATVDWVAIIELIASV